jgi:hypothetical protein
MHFIETHKLTGSGLGYVDVHLLAGARLGSLPLWTLDRTLNAAADRLELACPDAP